MKNQKKSSKPVPVATTVRGVITSIPESGRLAESGMEVCRFSISSEQGPATLAPVFRVYVKQQPGVERSEDLAIRCTRLTEGCVVEVCGEQRHRMFRRHRKDVLEVAILATDVCLKARPA